MKIISRSAAAVALILSVLPVPAGYGQDPSRTRPGTEETAIVEQANTQLAAVYKQLMNKLDAEGKKSLQEAQRSWIKWRDTEALLVGRVGGAVGGSALRVDFLNAQAALIRERTQILKGYLQKSAEN